MARGAHYEPTSPDAELPRHKRRRVEDSYDSHRPSRTADSARSSQSYRPGRGPDSYRPSRQRDSAAQSLRNDVAQSREDDTSSTRDSSRKNPESSTEQDDLQTYSTSIEPTREGFHSASQDKATLKNQKSKKARKENPSTRIHSLRKQLKRGNLPPTIQRERERELSSLVFEQEKKKLLDEQKQNLERYHFVRFIERQKATRELKKLTSVKRNLGKKESNPDLDRRLHEAEVDLTYTQYAPLGEKYISLYAAKETHKTKPGTSKERLAFLDAKQWEELQAIDTKPSKGIVRTSGNKAADGTSLKPPRWYDVEAAMKQGGSKLKELRNGKGARTQDIVLGLRSKTAKIGEKRNADWLDDKGIIDPADLDSDSEEDDQDGGVNLGKANDNDEDEDMSDGDGGFFERN